MTGLRDGSIFLINATIQDFPGLYYPGQDQARVSRAFQPDGSALSGRKARPTYLFGNILTFSIAAGYLTPRFHGTGGVDTSINSVPEPSSLVLCGIGGPIGLVVACRRRKRAA